jgi:hypothetical protein
MTDDEVGRLSNLLSLLLLRLDKIVGLEEELLALSGLG